MTSYDGYNDAWNTPGWTSQNMAYPAQTDQYTVDLPSDISLVTISGHFRDGDGGHANGWFDIDNGAVILKHTSTKEIITPIKIRVEVKDGVFQVTVPATDASTLTSSTTPWTYHVRLVLDGGKVVNEANVSLPAATPKVDAFDILTF